MTQATHPTPGKPLDQDSVKLLLPGDVLRTPRGRSGEFLAAQHGLIAVEMKSSGLLGSMTSAYEPSAFTFVSRPTPVGGDQEAQPSPAASGWRPISEYTGCGPALVSTAPDSAKYLASDPVTAFMDVTGVWRCLGSIGGCAELAQQPTHFAPMPARPALFPTPTQGDNHDQ